MADFNPQPIEVLQAQFVEMIEHGEVYKLDFTGEMPHDLQTLPSMHVFEFETGLQLCITLEETPMIFIPAVIGRRRQQEAQRRMTSPDSQYLHVSASWAESYLQPGPDMREMITEEITDRIVEQALSDAFDQVNNGVALLRRFYAEPVAQYIDEEGFVHVLWDRYAKVLAVIIPAPVPSNQNGQGPREPTVVEWINCPHCSALIATDYGAGEQITCAVCGQGVRLENG